jgi:hypothetical protein
MRRTILLFFVIVFSSVLHANQNIEKIEGFTSLVGMKGIVVNQVDRSQTSMLVDAGSIDTDGYTSLVINIAGQTEATNSKAGIVGAVLIPDIPPYDYAFKTLGLLPAIIEVTVPVEIGQQYFVAKQTKFSVGFPRYRVLFYNTGDATVRLAFFAYRTRE